MIHLLVKVVYVLSNFSLNIHKSIKNVTFVNVYFNFVNMKQIAVFLLFLLMTAFHLRSETIEYSDSTIVSLITCEPGRAVYTKFGHTAIRIRDTKGLDLVYNYGVFDFKTENFYLKFLRGHTDYMLAVYPTELFMHDYRKRNSTVWEQVLNLTKAEKDRLIELLHINYLPENRMYRYNFFNDNCSTRPYHIISEAVTGAIIFDQQSKFESARTMITNYLSDTPWVELGVNLVFGLDADKLLNENQSIFLPEYLKNYVQQAKILHLDNGFHARPLVHHAQTLFMAKRESPNHLALFVHPFLITTLWLIMGGLIMKYRRNMDSVTNRLFDFVLFMVTGIAGLVLFLFMFFSEHPLVDKNLNLLWLNPLNIIVALLIWSKKSRSLLFYYNIVYMLMMIVYFIVTVSLTHTTLLLLLPMQALLFLRVLLREKFLLHALYVPTNQGIRKRKE